MTREEFIINQLALKIAQNEVDAASRAYQEQQQRQEQAVEENK